MRRGAPVARRVPLSAEAERKRRPGRAQKRAEPRRPLDGSPALESRGGAALISFGPGACLASPAVGHRPDPARGLRSSPRGPPNFPGWALRGGGGSACCSWRGSRSRSSSADTTTPRWSPPPVPGRRRGEAGGRVGRRARGPARANGIGAGLAGYTQPPSLSSSGAARRVWREDPGVLREGAVPTHRSRDPLMGESRPWGRFWRCVLLPLICSGGQRIERTWWGRRVARFRRCAARVASPREREHAASHPRVDVLSPCTRQSCAATGE